MALVHEQHIMQAHRQSASKKPKPPRHSRTLLLVSSLWNCLRSAPWVPLKWRHQRPLDFSPVDPKELTSEHNFFDVFIASLRIAPSSYALPIGFAASLLLSVYALFTAPDTQVWASLVRNWAESGISFTTTVLGFLVTGFTIFASLGPSRMFKSIALQREERSGLPFIKYAFFGLMRVFVIYLLFAAFCFSIKIFFFPDGPISTLIRFLPDRTEEHVLRFLDGALFIGLGGSFFYTLISSSSFIYNVCYFVLHIVRWEIEHPESKEK